MKTISLRFWIEMLAAVSAIAFALALLIASLGAAGAAAADGGQSQSAKPAQPIAVPQQTYEGVITDTHCGAKHSPDAGKTAGDCTLACVHGGERFSLVDGDKMYILEGEPAALKHAAGERVKIIGTLNGKTILVASVATAAS
jgi:hypothetical protein